VRLPLANPSGGRIRQAWRYLGLAAASLRPRRRPSARGAPTLAYAEAELLRRNEEFNRAAEQQWQTIASEPSGREHVLNKPFSTVRDTSAILFRLSLVLDVLDLGVGHTVLDFGAGSCWLSACLNRLRCHTVSVDVSPTALALGQEAFGLDPRQVKDLDARFVTYDGQTLPLASESVDRVVCFDSFHHVPNQDAILGELFRVLRPGGRVVLAEPGEGHAEAEHSRFETSHFGVLENDLDLADLFGRARRVGFDRFLTKPYPDAPAITLEGDDCLRLMNGDHSVFPMPLLERSLRSFYLVALLKGEPRVDSRNPRTLRAGIQPAPGVRLAGRAGEAVSLPLRVENLGDTLWLATLDPAGGYVSLGGHLLDEQRRPVTRCFFADALPRDVAPAEAVEFEARVHLPEQLGRYVLRLDLVDERVAWFEQCGSSTVDVDLVVEGWPDSRSEPFGLGSTQAVSRSRRGRASRGARTSRSARPRGRAGGGSDLPPAVPGPSPRSRPSRRGPPVAGAAPCSSRAPACRPLRRAAARPGTPRPAPPATRSATACRRCSSPAGAPTGGSPP
jgi:SAM-dependent methyltransferase